MKYLVAVVSTLFAWIVGLFLDANLSSGEMIGFWEFRILLPMIIMGICILYNINNNKNE